MINKWNYTLINFYIVVGVSDSMDKSYALYKEVDFHFNNGAEWDEWIQANANRVVKEMLQGDIKPLTHLKMREMKNLYLKSPVDVVLVIIYYPLTPDTEEEEIIRLVLQC